MDNIPPWVNSLAEGGEFKHHLKRLIFEQHLSEDDVYNLLVVEGAELDLEELETNQIQILSTQFIEMGNLDELKEKYGRELSEVDIAYEQLKCYYDQLFTYYINKENIGGSKMMQSRVAILCIVETDKGISPKHWTQLTNLLHWEQVKEWIPYVLEGENNSVAYGFMQNELYNDQFCNELKDTVLPILDDWNLENDTDLYTTSSGHIIYLAKHVDYIKQ